MDPKGCRHQDLKDLRLLMPLLRQFQNNSFQIIKELSQDSQSSHSWRQKRLSPSVWLRKHINSFCSNLPAPGNSFLYADDIVILHMMKRYLKKAVDPLPTRHSSLASMTPKLSSYLTWDYYNHHTWQQVPLPSESPPHGFYLQPQ